MAADIHAHEAAEQVPAVLHVIGLGDLDVAVVLAGRVKGDDRLLVVARLAVFDGVRHFASATGAVRNFTLGDFPMTRAPGAVVGIEINAGTHAGVVLAAGELEVRRVAGDQQVPVFQTAHVVDRVEHDGHATVGFSAFFKVSAGRQYQANHYEQRQDQRQCNHELEQTGHSAVSGGRSHGREKYAAK